MYGVIAQAQVSHLGHRGDRAILALAGNRSFALWTTSANQSPISGQCNLVFGTTVCQVGPQLVWEAQGLLLWIEPTPSPYESLRTSRGLPAGAALDRLVQASQSVLRVASQRRTSGSLSARPRGNVSSRSLACHDLEPR